MDGEQWGASLVIGGTGMLAGATRWIANGSAATLLVARRASRFAPQDRRLVAIDADWCDAAFRPRVQQGLASAPPIDRALLWLHEPAAILPWLLPFIPLARTVIVLGSMDGRSELPEGAAERFTVRLGSRAAANGRRWLTHAEISDAAVRAFRDGRSQVVGDLVAP
jgi:hypothetical protein